MSLSTDMNRLTTEVRGAIEFRQAAIGAMRDAVKSTLAGNATMRGEIARDYRAETQKYLAALTKDVAAQCQATAAQVMRFGSARRKASQQMRGNLHREVGTIMKQAHDLQTATGRMMKSLASANGKMAKQQKSALSSGRRKLREDMSGLLGELHADRIVAGTMWSQIRTAETPDKHRAPARRSAKSQPEDAEQASPGSRPRQEAASQAADVAKPKRGGGKQEN